MKGCQSAAGAEFKIVTSIFAADGDETYDVQRRIAMAMNRMGELRHVFNSKISFGLKLKIYKTAVCSTQSPEGPWEDRCGS